MLCPHKLIFLAFSYKHNIINCWSAENLSISFFLLHNCLAVGYDTLVVSWAICRWYSKVRRFKNLTCILVVQLPSYNQLHRPFCFTGLKHYGSSILLQLQMALCEYQFLFKCGRWFKRCNRMTETRRDNFVMSWTYFLTVRKERKLKTGADV